ncbi:MAG: hypothetical protein AAGD96_15330 [Chloroflexota bacterium]
MKSRTIIFKKLILGGSFTLLAGVLLSACELQATQNSAPASDTAPTVIVPTPVDTPEPSFNEPVNEENAVREAALRAITIWVLPEIEISTDTPAGNIFTQQIDTFDANHPEVELNLEQKSIVGEGSLFDYFATAKNVAPNILPDLVLVPHNVLPELVEQEIVFPLDELISAEEFQDLYPAADQLVVVNDSSYGYPYAISGLTHAAYNTAVYSDTLPSRLDQIIGTTLRPAFPAAGKEGAELLLQLYVDEGGQIYNNEGELEFENTPMLVALRRIQALRASDLIDPSVGDIADREEMWLSYKSGASNLILTTDQLFLTEYRETADLGFDRFPGSIGGLEPYTEGWVWAVSTADPVRQALAIELLTWMSNGPNMADWTFASQSLPARQSALQLWPQDDYATFLDQELQRATVKPEILDSNVGSILQGAMQALFAADNPPVQNIADNAVAAINGN